jgi:hypothetical protein
MGHLGSFPAQLVVKRFTDIEVVPNAKSPYDYAFFPTVLVVSLLAASASIGSL